jgi:hypothetical protein
VLSETGIKEVPSTTPPVQVYVKAPVPLKFKESPSHNVVDGSTVIPTVGIGFTVMVTLLEFVHPFAPVPVTV